MSCQLTRYFWFPVIDKLRPLLAIRTMIAGVKKKVILEGFVLRSVVAAHLEEEFRGSFTDITILYASYDSNLYDELGNCCSYHPYARPRVVAAAFLPDVHHNHQASC